MKCLSVTFVLFVWRHFINLYRFLCSVSIRNSIQKVTYHLRCCHLHEGRVPVQPLRRPCTCHIQRQDPRGCRDHWHRCDLDPKPYHHLLPYGVRSRCHYLVVGAFGWIYSRCSYCNRRSYRNLHLDPSCQTTGPELGIELEYSALLQSLVRYLCQS